MPGDLLLRLEHLIIAHQRLPEWGSPKPPMTPEALLVHYADDIDAKFSMMAAILADDANPGPLTSKKNVLMQHVYRGDGGVIRRASTLRYLPDIRNGRDALDSRPQCRSFRSSRS